MKIRELETLDVLESLDLVPEPVATVTPAQMKEFLSWATANTTWVNSGTIPPEIVAGNTVNAVTHPEPTNTQIAEVLEAAADLFESEKLGWIQGVETKVDSFGLRVTAACAIGAISQARVNGIRIRWANEALYRAALLAVTNYLNERPGRLAGEMSIPGWNDMPGRTVGEVIDLFKTVAKDLRNNNEQ